MFLNFGAEFGKLNNLTAVEFFAVDIPRLTYILLCVILVLPYYGMAEPKPSTPQGVEIVIWGVPIPLDIS